MPDQTYKFSGGVWIGYFSYTWPYAKLEISPERLTVKIEGLPFDRAKKELSFTHDEIEKVEVKKYFPVIAYGIRIVVRDKRVSRLFYFWYISFKFKKLISALKEFGWI